MTIKPFYDRSGLIERTIDTLRGALIEEVILVTLAHILFLWHFRSVLIVTIPLPASILISFILMQQFGITSNIMSLAGIAIAIGVLVDAAIVITENVIRHCEQATEKKGSPLTAAETLHITREASTQVGRPVFFAMAIIILAFLPVFALTGQEGKLFHPLAFTKTFAMVSATLLAVTIVPVLCSWLVRGPFRPEGENWIMRPLLGLYRPALDWSLAHGRIILGLPCCCWRAHSSSPSDSPARGIGCRGKTCLGWLASQAGWAPSSCRRSTKAACSSCLSSSRARRSPKSNASWLGRTA